MIRLDQFPHKFLNIRLKNCGLLFLSTPHSGTKEADWNKYLVDIGEITVGLRAEIINELRSFNRSSVDSQEHFRNMKIIPPLFCLCESEKTRVGPSLRYALGSPPILSPYSPLPKGVKFYEGRHIRRVNGFTGRSQELKKIAGHLSGTRRGTSNGIVLTGIGGIGKTELLLQIANQNRNLSNVFLLPACDEKSLRDGYMEIASRIGHEILSERHPKQDLYSIWCGSTTDEKIEATKAWFEAPENQDTLFIVDDLDGLKDEDAIQAVLPRQANIVMLSTRNPGLVAELPRKFDRLRVLPLNVSETIDLMGASLHNWNKENIPIPEEELEEIAKEVACHPLGALNAISYITARLAQDSDSPVAEFFAILRSVDYHERLEFLKYKPPFRYSITQAFDISVQRLRNPNGLATALLSVLGFLELEEPAIDFRRFFSRREWLHELKEYLPDYAIFATEKSALRAALEELENVSIGHRTEQKLPLEVHPLWIECMRQRLGHDGRIRFLRQVLLVCYGSIIRREELTNIIPHIKTCLCVAVRFQISMGDLDLAPDMRTWIDGFSTGPKTPPSTIVPNTSASRFEQDNYKTALELSDDCARVAENVISDAVDIVVSQEKWTILSQSLLSLLKRLQKQESIYQKPLGEEIYGLHMRTYDSLLKVASQIRERHPTLYEQLQTRRATFEEMFRLSD
ncbi:P-loop containing nucleoside triphosphate hydrolase protein [Tricladium varicosporioides]|nr:P-loop containing nucleoside triphosphate hydrolase protein [Hymenoscyphus varicosporioides]